MEENKNMVPEGSNNSGNVIGWVERILKLKKDYGIGSLISAFMLLFVTIIMGVVAFRPDIIFNEVQKIQAEQHQEAVQKRLDADPQIKAYLMDLRGELGADRVFIVETHNGGTNLTNLPFLYVDMTYESCRRDEILLQDEYKNVRLQRYEFSTYVYKNNFWFGSIEDLRKIDDIFYYRLEGDGVKYFGALTLYGAYNIVGAIGVEYTTSEPKEYSDVKQIMYKNANKISYLLNNDILEK